MNFAAIMHSELVEECACLRSNLRRYVPGLSLNIIPTNPYLPSSAGYKEFIISNQLTEVVMHEDLTHATLTELFDMLSVQTNRYMKMLAEGATREDFNFCREIIIDIQTEIQERQNRGENNETTESENITFN